MIETDILKLCEQSDRSLVGLECDIWAGVDSRLKAKRASRTILSYQAAILVVALFGSVVAGKHAAVVDNTGTQVGMLSTHAEFAPSNRLIER